MKHCISCKRAALHQHARCLSCHAALIRRLFGLDTMAGRLS